MANKTHENMLSITRYFRNASQNYNEILLHTGQNGYRQKNLQNKTSCRGFGERELLVGMKIDTATMENSMGSP